MSNIILKFKILFLKIYSKSNYKTNIFFFFNKLKKKNNIINTINYIINNLKFFNKNIISKNIYLFTCDYYIYINKYVFFELNNYFLKNIYLNYTKLELKIINKYLSINYINLNLKQIKKIYTRLLLKNNKMICESLTNRLIITILNINLDEKTNKLKKFFFFISNYKNINFFNYFNEVRKTCILLNLIENKYYKKIYIGILSYPFKKKPHYFYYLINYLLKNNNLKIEISIDIYHIDLIKIINFIKKIKILKIILSIGIPDLFIEFLIKKKKWYLFDPKEIKEKYNYYIQNLYDEYVGYGSFRKMFNLLLNDINIFKISIDVKKFFLKILKINFLNFFYLDIINRNNVNKQISNIYCNFYHSKIYEKKNYFKDKKLFYNNNVININKLNINYIEIFSKIQVKFCKFQFKKIIKQYIITDIKNEILINNKKKNFYLNFKTNPILIKINVYNKKIYKEYLYYNFFIINCFLSYLSESYCWYYNNDISNQNFFLKQKYLNFYWSKVINLINYYELKNSLYINLNNKNYNFKITFDNFFIKTLIINWQLKNEDFKF